MPNKIFKAVRYIPLNKSGKELNHEERLVAFGDDTLYSKESELCRNGELYPIITGAKRKEGGPVIDVYMLPTGVVIRHDDKDFLLEAKGRTEDLENPETSQLIVELLGMPVKKVPLK